MIVSDPSWTPTAQDADDLERMVAWRYGGPARAAALVEYRNAIAGALADLVVQGHEVSPADYLCRCFRLCELLLVGDHDITREQMLRDFPDRGLF